MFFSPILLALPFVAFTFAADATSGTVNVNAIVSSRQLIIESASYTNDSKYRDDMLSAHNFFRKAHNVTALKWNTTLASVAADWSEGCVFEHSGKAYGENLALGYPNATANVDAWALEREVYNFNKPGFSSATGHFTQLVWSNTTSVGCGRTDCNGDAKGWLVVCEYYPAGNVLGANGDTRYFKDNVLPQVLGKKTDTVESGVTSTSDAAGRGGDVCWGFGVFMAAAVVCFGIGW